MTAQKWAHRARIAWYAAAFTVGAQLVAWILVWFGWIRMATFIGFAFPNVATIWLALGIAVACEIAAKRALGRARRFRTSLARTGIRAGDWVAATSSARHRRGGESNA